ncbi:MAG: SDR family oxidoreductase [Bacteroidetes bacterium]|nr:SDR family oxidoreductase [Bacteroidota bacterium]
MKTILITGSNGLLGQKLVKLLSGQGGHFVVATSLSANRMPHNESYLFELMDITNASEINYIFSKHQPDIIINTAAMTSVDVCEENRADCWKVNVEGPALLAAAANNIGARLIQISTDFVFDGLTGPYSEEATPNPVSFYGISKLEAERMTVAAAKRWSVIRTILVYGFNTNMSRPTFVQWVVNNLSENKSIRVVDDQFRAPTLDEDLASACIEAAARDVDGFWHVSGRDFLSIYDFAVMIAGIFGLDGSLITPVNSTELNEKGKRPPRTGFILDKAITGLGYNPCSLSEGLQKVRTQTGD